MSTSGFTRRALGIEDSDHAKPLSCSEHRDSRLEDLSLSVTIWSSEACSTPIRRPNINKVTCPSAACGASHSSFPYSYTSFDAAETRTPWQPLQKLAKRDTSSNKALQGDLSRDIRTGKNTCLEAVFSNKSRELRSGDAYQMPKKSSWTLSRPAPQRSSRSCCMAVFFRTASASSLRCRRAETGA